MSDDDYWKHKYEKTEEARVHWMRRHEEARDALVALVNAAPSADELRLLCVGVNGPAMANPENENGRRLHARCDQLKKARDAATKIINETSPV